MKTTAEKIAVMQAYEDGKTIIVNWGIEGKEERIKKNYGEQEWNWNACDYSIKPEHKQVPFDESDYESILGKKIKHVNLKITGILTLVGNGKIVIGNREFGISLGSVYLFWYNETVNEWMPCMKTTTVVNN